MTAQELARRCRELREAAGLSQIEAAAMIGVDQSVLSRIESGGRRVDTLLLQRLADAYGVSAAAFFEPIAHREPLAAFLRRNGQLDAEVRAGLEWLRQVCEEYTFLRQIEEAG
ncbi:MAG: helix-turn-helix transcriptional regulator [Chloroflexi bacterium]|nr:helix-turn-helix transcriptional regulator [Chloroflexota bacterium]